MAEVAVPLPVNGLFHYSIPERLIGRDLAGCLVLVPFGNRRVSGVVVRCTSELPPGVNTVRPIDALLDQESLVVPELLALCTWIASYYRAPIGEVMRAALPAGMRVSAGQSVELTEKGNQALQGQAGILARRHRDLLGILDAAGGMLLQRELMKRGRGRVADIAALVEASYVRFAQPSAETRVKARTVRFAVLARTPTEQERQSLVRAAKRLAVLDAIVAADGAIEIGLIDVPRAADHVRRLVKDGWVHIENRAAALEASSDTAAGFTAPSVPPTLTAAQTTALNAIVAAAGAGTFQAFLLHGVTGSGKTEVYLHAIGTVLESGRTAIVLVPEISLTPQLASRFRARFGARVAVLHSGLSDRERHDEWRRLRRGEASIALGARSAIYAPVENVGIVVVDEEHDSSFKQEEGVRYNARDVALVRTQRAGAVCVLGSATPSLESYVATREGRYHLLQMPERATPSPLPAVDVVDLRIHRPDPDGMLTAQLAEAIGETLQRKEQVILFLNRRGFSTFVICRACGHAFRCRECSVSQTYHRGIDRLVCHYCGLSDDLPTICPGCHAADSIVRRGLGTEKVAETVAARFPEARVARIDRDVGDGRKIEAVLATVARGEVNILVGTQMVTKGHDFPRVTLVGVLCADTGLSMPDFRASERTFQLLTQVAGRAGRGDRPGRVVVQTYSSDSIVVRAAAAQDYLQFSEAEIEIRKELGYPPFGHLVAIRIDGRNAAAVEQAARTLASRASVLRKAAGIDSGLSVLGPTEAPLARIRGRTRWHMWLRAPERRQLRAYVRGLTTLPDGSELSVPGVRLTVDVDPVSTL